MDVVEHSIKAGGPSVILPYVYDLTMTVVQDQAYRNTLLQLLVDQFRKLEEPDYVAINQCLVHLGHHQASADLLQKLVSSGAQVSGTPRLWHCLLIRYPLFFIVYNTKPPTMS